MEEAAREKAAELMAKMDDLKKDYPLLKANGAHVPKSWFVDPYAAQDSLGLGYRAHPLNLSYETLKQIAQREPIIASIIQTRVNQVSSFCKPQPNKYSIGFRIRPRNSRHKLTREDKENIERLESLVMNCGRGYKRSRDSFTDFIKKMVRDSMIWDQACVETVRNSFGNIISFFAVPSESFRIVLPRADNKKGTPGISGEVRYVQLVDGTIANNYTDDELIFGVRNPRTDMRAYGYGMSEIEVIFRIVTALLWGVEWNVRSFSQGATIKGILNLKGQINPVQMEMFKRQWALQTAGVGNAWKTPVMNTEGVEWMPMQMTNNEMGYQQWLEFLIKVACGIYLMDPAEINFDLRGSSQTAPVFMSTNEAQQKVSKDRGLAPLLRFIEDRINRFIIWSEDDRYEFSFVGLDAKTEEQAIELRLKAIQYMTANEVREMDDLPPVEDGDIILNPTYTGYRQQKAQMQQQAQQAQQGQGGAGGQPGGGPGGPPQVQEAYADHFKKDKPFDREEAHAKNNLEEENASHEESPLIGPRKDEETGQEDWETTIRASLDDLDLFKAEDVKGKRDTKTCYWCSSPAIMTKRLADGRGGKVGACAKHKDKDISPFGKSRSFDTIGGSDY